MGDAHNHRSKSRTPSAKSDVSASSRSRSKSRDRKRKPSPSRSRSHSKSHSHRHRHKHRHQRRRSRSRSVSRSRSRSRGGRGDSPGRGRPISRSPYSGRRRHMGDRERPTECKCLGIFGLNLETTERDIRDLFGRYGPIDSVNIVYDKQSGRSRGFGFVYYKNLDDAVYAKGECSGIEMDGRTIRVDYSITQRPHTPTPGVYLGRPQGRSGGGGYRRRTPEPYGRNYYQSRSPSY